MRNSYDPPPPVQTPPPSEMATEAGGTHPTGMHSCYCVCNSIKYGLTGQSLLKIQFEISCLNNCMFQCAIFNFSGSFKLELALKSPVY